MPFPVILSLIYYFQTLLSRHVNSPRRCDTKKDGGGMSDLPFKPNFHLLLYRNVVRRYTHPQVMRCQQRWRSIKLTLTYYFETLLSRDVNSLGDVM